MASNSETNTSPTKKRSWGRSMQREKINIVENMELEIPDKPMTAGDSKAELAPISNETSVDLQHPEFLSTAKLVNLLTEHKVPIPVYEDGSTSRDRLLFLFKKHIVPRPQRKNRQKHIYKDQIYKQQNEMGVANTIDWDLSNESRSWDGGGKGNGGVLGKRRLIQNDEETTLCKKVHTAPIKETTCMPATETTPTAGVTPTTVRKLKRPRQSEVAIDSKIRNENDAYS